MYGKGKKSDFWFFMDFVQFKKGRGPKKQFPQGFEFENFQDVLSRPYTET